MEPAPTDYETLPEFGPNSSMASPDSTTLDVGYQSGETFPVTEANWLFNKITNNSNVSERLAKSAVAELDYLCTQNGVTPNGSVNTQVNQAVNNAIAAEATLARNANNLTSGTVALARIPNTLTGKDADTLDSYHAKSFLISEIYNSIGADINIQSLLIGQSIYIIGNAAGVSIGIYSPSGGTYKYQLHSMSTTGTSSIYASDNIAGSTLMGNIPSGNFFTAICKRLT